MCMQWEHLRTRAAVTEGGRMSADPWALCRRLEQATAEEQELVLRFLLGKRTAEMGRASPLLDLFLAELEMELPGAVELLGGLRFKLGAPLHREVAAWAQGGPKADALYRRVLQRYRVLFCAATP